MARVEAVGGVGAKLGLALDAGEQECIGHGLGVRVGEARIVGVGEEDVAPLAREGRKRRVAIPERCFHCMAQEARKRSEGIGQCLGGARDDRLPAQEVFEQRLERRCGHRTEGPRAVLGDVAIRADHTSDEPALAIQGPFVAVGVDQIWMIREPLELLAIVDVREPARGRSLARRLQLDVPDREEVQRDADIGAHSKLRGARLRQRVHARTVATGDGFHELYDGRFELLFCLGVERCEGRELARQTLTESLEVRAKAHQNILFFAPDDRLLSD